MLNKLMATTKMKINNTTEIMNSIMVPAPFA
jgi:hypothetical protein